jgi:hypothetical protein
MGVFSTGAMGALAPAIFGHFISQPGSAPAMEKFYYHSAPAILKS